MKLAPAIALGLLLVASALAVVPTASATTCHADPEALEPACRVVDAYFCIQYSGGVSYKDPLHCLA